MCLFALDFISESMTGASAAYLSIDQLTSYPVLKHKLPRLVIGEGGVELQPVNLESHAWNPGEFQRESCDNLVIWHSCVSSLFTGL
jgi:hypothetical protein